MMQHTNMLWRFCVALGVGGKENCGKTYEFLRKGSSNNCIIVKSFFFFPTSNLLWKQDRVFSFLSDIAYFKCTKFLQVFCNLGQFCIKMWLPLQIYFPLAVTGKIFLYSILFLGTFWSMVPTKWHAVVPCRKRLNPWLINQHWARWWGLGGTKRQAGELISGPGQNAKAKLMSFNRTQWMAVIGLLNGHNTWEDPFTG